MTDLDADRLPPSLSSVGSQAICLQLDVVAELSLRPGELPALYRGPKRFVHLVDDPRVLARAQTALAVVHWLLSTRSSLPPVGARNLLRLQLDEVVVRQDRAGPEHLVAKADDGGA